MLQRNEGRRRHVQSNLMETPGAQCPGWLETDTGPAQIDNHESGVVDGHEKVRATFRELDEAKQSARTSILEPDRARMAVRIERPKANRDARCASMQFPQQVNRGFGVDPRQRQIG